MYSLLGFFLAPPVGDSVLMRFIPPTQICNEVKVSKVTNSDMPNYNIYSIGTSKICF